MTPLPITDSALLRTFATTRDPAAFRQLVDRHLPTVHAAATRILRSMRPPLTQHADDIAQSVFLLLAQHANKIPADTPLIAWLYKVTHYACSNLQRIEQRRIKHEQESATMHPATTSPPTISDAEALLDPALLSLSEPDRTALLLRYTQNLSIQEIAAATKVPQETAKKRLHRALTKLRKYFATHGLLASTPLALTALTPAPTPAHAALAATITTTALAPLTTKTTTYLIAKGVTHMLNLAKFVKAAAACLTLLTAALSTVLIVKASAPQVPSPAPAPPTPPPVTLAAAVSTPPAPAQNNADASLSALRNGIIDRELRYQSGHYDFTVSTYNSTAPDKILLNYHVDLFKSGPKTQFTKTPLLPESKVGIAYNAWNGQIRTGYTHFTQATSPDQEYSGSIINNQDLAMRQKWEGIVKEKIWNGDLTILDLVRQENCQSLGEKNIGNYQAQGLAWTDGNYEFELWVVPDDDFAPVELIQRNRYTNGVVAVTRTTDTALIKIDDRWITKSAKTVTTNPQIASYDQIEAYELNKYESSIPAGMDFMVRFPVGTGVFDSVQKRGFIAGKLVEAKDSSDQTRYLDIKLFPEYDKLTDYSTGLSPEQWAQTTSSRATIEPSLDSLNTVQSPTNNEVPFPVGRSFGGKSAPLVASPYPEKDPPDAIPLATSSQPRENTSLLFLGTAVATAGALAWIFTRQKKSP